MKKLALLLFWLGRLLENAGMGLSRRNSKREWIKFRAEHPELKDEQVIQGAQQYGNTLSGFRLLLLVSIICSAYPVRAQTIGLAAGFEPSSVPRSSGVLQYIYGSGATRPYTAITARPIGIEGVSFSASAGVIRRLAGGVYRVPGFQGYKQVFLETFAQGGVATSGAATSGIVNGGGSLVFPTRYGVAWVLSGEAVVAPINNELQARVSAGLRFNFQ